MLDEKHKLRKLQSIAELSGWGEYYYFCYYCYCKSFCHPALRYVFVCNFGFRSIERFAYALVSFVFSMFFYVSTHTLSYVVCHSPFSGSDFLGSLFCLFPLYMSTIPLSFVLISLTLILLSLPVVPPRPRGGNNYTCYS